MKSKCANLGFCEQCTHEKQYASVTFSDSILLHPSKQVEDGDLVVSLEMELEETPISLGFEDVVLDPIQVLEIQHYGFMPNLDVRLLLRDGIKDMVAESTNMATKSGSVIEFKGGLNSIHLKEN